MIPEPEATAAEPLQFDRVIHSDPVAEATMSCAACAAPITDRYYHDGERTLCAACGGVQQRDSAPDRRARTLLRALAFGFGAALAGGILYWAMMEYLDLQLGLVAIAIGYMVGRAVARATRGRSARRHRVLAVLLTYLAVAIAYAPFAFKAAKEDDAKEKATATATATAPSATAQKADSAAPTPPAAPAKAGAPKEKTTFGGFLLALGALAGLLLALPVMASLMSMPGGLLSLLIIGFGLRQAWTISAAENTHVAGPLTVGGAAA